MNNYLKKLAYISHELEKIAEDSKPKRKNQYPVGDAGNQYGLRIPKPNMPITPPASPKASKRKNTYPVGDAGNQYGLQIPKPKMPITPPPGQNSIVKNK